jgi:hypothetical protein
VTGCETSKLVGQAPPPVYFPHKLWGGQSCPGSPPGTPFRRLFRPMDWPCAPQGPAKSPPRRGPRPRLAAPCPANRSSFFPGAAVGPLQWATKMTLRLSMLPHRSLRAKSTNREVRYATGKNNLVSRSRTLACPLGIQRSAAAARSMSSSVQRLARLIFAVGRLIAPQFVRDGSGTKAEWHWAAPPAHGLSGSL